MAWTVRRQIVQIRAKRNGSPHEADTPGCLSRFDCQQPGPQRRAISECVASSERDLEGRLDHVLRLLLVEANQSSRAQEDCSVLREQHLERRRRVGNRYSFEAQIDLPCVSLLKRRP